MEVPGLFPVEQINVYCLGKLSSDLGALSRELEFSSSDGRSAH